MSHSDFVKLGEDINALDFDTVFRILGGAVVPCAGEYAPAVYHDEACDVVVDGSGWECFTGLTGQYSYNGAVMHASEFVGCCIASYLSEHADEAMFALVVVNCLDSEDAAGWAIAYRRIADGSEQS